MNKVVYPGSFDPITNGHLDIIKRAAYLYPEVIVGVLINPDKIQAFTASERIELIRKVTKEIPNVKVKAFSGLLINFMKENHAKIIIKGLRAVSDFEYELQMALMNRKLDAEIETIFMMASAEYMFLSSSAIKQVAAFGGSIEGMVPEDIIPEVMTRVNKF